MGKDLRPACLAQEKEMPTHMGLQGHTYKLDLRFLSSRQTQSIRVMNLTSKLI
jgi:hypothetical protein